MQSEFANFHKTFLRVIPYDWLTLYIKNVWKLNWNKNDMISFQKKKTDTKFFCLLTAFWASFTRACSSSNSPSSSHHQTTPTGSWEKSRCNGANPNTPLRNMAEIRVVEPRCREGNDIVQGVPLARRGRKRWFLWMVIFSAVFEVLKSLRRVCLFGIWLFLFN